MVKRLHFSGIELCTRLLLAPGPTPSATSLPIETVSHVRYCLLRETRLVRVEILQGTHNKSLHAVIPRGYCVLRSRVLGRINFNYYIPLYHSRALSPRFRSAPNRSARRWKDLTSGTRIEPTNGTTSTLGHVFLHTPEAIQPARAVSRQI